MAPPKTKKPAPKAQAGIAGAIAAAAMKEASDGGYLLLIQHQATTNGIVILMREHLSPDKAKEPESKPAASQGGGLFDDTDDEDEQEEKKTLEPASVPPTESKTKPSKSSGGGCLMTVTARRTHLMKNLPGTSKDQAGSEAQAGIAGAIAAAAMKEASRRRLSSADSAPSDDEWHSDSDERHLSPRLKLKSQSKPAASQAVGSLMIRTMRMSRKKRRLWSHFGHQQSRRLSLQNLQAVVDCLMTVTARKKRTS